MLPVKFKPDKTLFALLEKAFVLVSVVDVEDKMLIPPATPLTIKLPPLKLALPLAEPMPLITGTIANEGDTDTALAEGDEEEETEEAGDNVAAQAELRSRLWFEAMVVLHSVGVAFEVVVDANAVVVSKRLVVDDDDDEVLATDRFGEDKIALF